ncbi:MAG: hydroxymethylglutaryl-CoA lyase [Moraxella sp.]|nr:hydroxymethylglutaryl-CoA lyase [Moraxella sp.]
MNNTIKIVEVGARDGLQNEPTPLDIDDKVQLINLLIQAGLRHIEAGSCVSPKWVRQMAGSTDVFTQVSKQLPKDSTVNLSLLTPNLKGYEAARTVDCKEVAVFVSASETFSQKNINCSISDSLERARQITTQAATDGVRVRGYVSCMVDCPYEGFINPVQVADIAQQLHKMGCYEISLGDTIGTATPNQVQAVWQACLTHMDASVLAGHFHDTYGMAIANVYASLSLGIRTFDASIAGLGGCPYAKGASGNVATEDLYYLLNRMGFDTGIDLDKLMHASRHISERLNRPSRSSYATAYWQGRA